MKDTLSSLKKKKKMASESVTAVANPEDHKHCINFQLFTLEVELYCSGIAHAKQVQYRLKINLTFFYNGQPYNDLLKFYSGTTYLPLDYTLGLKSGCIFVTVKILKVGTALFQNQQSPNKSQKIFKRGNDPLYLQKPIQE